MHPPVRIMSIALAGLLVTLRGDDGRAARYGPGSGRCPDGGHGADRGVGAGAAGDARRSRSSEGAVSLRRPAEDAMVEPSEPDVSAQRPADGRSHAAAARGGDDAAVGRAEPGRLSQGDRDHARRRSASEDRRLGPAARRPERRRQPLRIPPARPAGAAGARRRRRLRRGRVLPRVRRHAVGDGAVDAAVRRTSPGDQPDAARKPGDDGAQPAGGAAGDLHVRGSDDTSAGTRERQGLRADQRAGRRASAARRSSATACRTSCSDPARTGERFSPKGFARRRSPRRSKRCCGTSCGNGPAS